MFRSLFYNIKQGFLQIFRNKGMSVASIFSIVAMLLILGIFFTITVNINMFTDTVKQDYDQIEVYLQDGLMQNDVSYLIETLEGRTGVENVEYRSPDDALNILKARWGDSGYLLDSLGENPLPASLVIKVDSLDNAAQVATYAGSLHGIEDVTYYKETVEKLNRITNFLQVASIIIMVFLIVVSIVVVSNTVKLTVFARAKEIQIMKYVGATNWFVRGPFLSEGIIMGIIAAIISTGLITLIYNKVMDIVGDQVLAIVQSPLISAEFMAQNLIVIFICLGVAIGTWGSIISMRRFLDA